MSISTIEQTMERIAFAKPESQIAVFTCNIPGHVNAVFAATIHVQARIAHGDPTLIGVFDGLMKKRHIQQMLEQAART
jgi:hypothetical protein